MRNYSYGPNPGTKAFSNLLIFLFGFFAVFGFVFLFVGAGWLRSDNEFFKTAEQTVGTVEEVYVDSEGNMSPIVRYTANGKEYVRKMNGSSQSYEIGSEIKVYFSADDPQNARASDFSGGIVFIIVGSIFAVVGLTGTAVCTIPKIKGKALIKNGERISAKITEVRCIDNVRVNGFTPYKVYCDSSRAPETNGKPFVSKNIYFTVPNDVAGKYISVYIDSKNPRKYIVDTEELKNL